MSLEILYHILFRFVLIFMALLLFACLVRAVKGPRVTDRIVAVNMMGTMVIVMIAVFALLLKQEYLLDICLIYAMISFLAVIVLTKVYTGVFLSAREKEKDGVDAKGEKQDV